MQNYFDKYLKKTQTITVTLKIPYMKYCSNLYKLIDNDIFRLIQSVISIGKILSQIYMPQITVTMVPVV